MVGFWRLVARLAWSLHLRRLYGFAHVKAIDAHCAALRSAATNQRQE